MRLWPFALLGLGAVLAGCVQKPEQHASVTTYSVDFRGAAKDCTAPKTMRLAADKPADAAIKVANDGGWCAVSVEQGKDKPFDAGLLTSQPQHGTVYIHTVGLLTRIDYTPESRYAGPDAFVVQLVPGGETLSVKVTVAPPPAAGGKPTS